MRVIKKMESKPPDLIEFVPFVAGVFGAIAMVLQPFPAGRTWSWVPLILSTRSILNVLYAVGWGIHFKRWPFNSSIKSVLKRLLNGTD